MGWGVAVAVGSVAFFGDRLAAPLVAHELRAPLSALAAASEILERDFLSIDRQQLREMVGTIRARTLGLHALLENLLCAGSISNGRFAVHPRRADLRDIYFETSALVMPLLARREQELRGPRRSMIVRADDRRLIQALVNLIANASKFAPAGTAIEVSFGRRADRVRVTVADRGTGFNGSARALFDPFQQGGAASSGVGLGLSIVRAIVEAHGGTVGARNRRGGGARFWFELPNADDKTIDNEKKESATP